LDWYILDGMSHRPLPATAHVVLGLASIRPTTGHELAAFSERSIGNFFPIARSQIYLELERLCRLGLLEVTEIAQERRPTKRVYEITRSGGDELRRWLDETPLEPERTRNLFLVRVFFGDRVSPDRLERTLDEYEALARTQCDRLTAVVERLDGRPEAALRRATALFGVRHAQATLDWAAEIRPIVQAARSARSGPG
jgi:DNA-binding PadR family transcriptional regulator